MSRFRDRFATLGSAARWLWTLVRDTWIFVRGMIGAIPISPIGSSLTEIVFVVFFTFAPFVLLSIPWVESSGDLNGSTVTARFLTFWDNGQLALPILALCGGIASLCALNSPSYPRFLNTVAWLMALGVAGAGWFVLSETKGFTEVLQGSIVFWGFAVYLGLLFLWGVLSVLKETRRETEHSDERARRLLAEKQRAERGEA